MAAVDTTTAQFTAPAIGSTVNIDIGNTDWLEVGAQLLIESAGVYDVSSITTSTRFVGRNLGYSVNAAATTVIASGVDVNPIGFSGTEPFSNYGANSPTTTKGDLIVDAGTNNPRATPTRQAVGSNGEILASNSTTGTGVDWVAVLPNSVTNDNNIPRYNGTTGTPMVLQDSGLLITDDGAIQSTPTGGNARGQYAVDLQVDRANNTEVASGANSVICGGNDNTASGAASTVCGGNNNTASGLNSAALGGTLNSASSGQSGVACGTSNTASNTNAFVGGGNGNTASGQDSAVTAGTVNSATGTSATVCGGDTNTAQGIGSVVCGGGDNQTSSDYSAIVGGNSAVADKYGQVAHAAGLFAAQGDAQTSELVFRISTTDATPTEMFLDGSSERAVIAISTAWVFTGYCVVREDATGDTKALSFSGVLKRNGTTTTALVAAVSPSSVAADAGASTWTLAVTADDANESLKLEVTGEAAHTLRWVAWVRLVEVSG